VYRVVGLHGALCVLLCLLCGLGGGRATFAVEDVRDVHACAVDGSVLGIDRVERVAGRHDGQVVHEGRE
jgi:hypothetical protein